MKKTLLKILSVALVVCMLFTVAACSKGPWEGTNMKNWGAVKEMGGFVAETDNYYYVINGIGASSEDNTFGTPIKGALVAVDKKDLSKAEIVVPKLFVAGDYKAGLFIDGDYVYYGTPSTDKTSEGTVANTELHFMRTKLDGTDTTEYFKLSGISSTYRIVKAGSSVLIVYYDTENTSLIAYDTASKSKTVIAKTDDKTATNYSLANYNFVGGDVSNVVLYYTTTIYAEEYLENKVDGENFTRATEAYNNLYAYKAGDTVDAKTGLAGTLIGSATGYTYAITMAGEYTFYTQTNVLDTTNVKTFGDTTKNLITNKKGVEIKNADYIADANLIISLDEVYTLSEGKVYRSTLTGDDKVKKEIVVANDKISSLLTVKDGSLYYINSSNKLARMELKEGANEIILSKGTVLTSWYKAEFFENKLFYLDNSANGVSYIKCIDLSAKVIEEDTNDDGENDSFYLDSEILVGVMTNQDIASKFESQVSAISSELENGVLPYEEKDGKLTVTAVTDARNAYTALSADVKELVEETTLATLENYEKAIEMANVYARLDGMYGYTNLSATEQQSLKTAYNDVKDIINAFMESDNYSSVINLIENNAKWNFQRAVELFEAE